MPLMRVCPSFDRLEAGHGGGFRVIKEKMSILLKKEDMTMTNFDLTPFLRSTIGFDRMTRLLENELGGGSASGYPPYNIVKLDENDYQITMAVAGFSENDLTITLNENLLVVEGRIADAEKDEQRQYLHRGIAERAFERRFQLADHIRVLNASLENGLLTVDLAREIPESMKPRKIEITSSNGKTLLDHKKGAKKAA